MEGQPNQIYDVGLFDGADTAYYLFRGYNVVAVDANPLMIEKARSRFHKHIEASRLTLLNVGIGATPGTATFWISDNPEWSSFDRTIASRNGMAHRPLSISVVPFSQILLEHGVPHYLKIDIEGNDRLCVEALGAAKLPKYISVETECVGDSRVLSDEEAVAMLELLRNVGYRRFKLVNQADVRCNRLKRAKQTWTQVRSSAAVNFCTRLVTSAARGRLRVRGLSKIAENFIDSPPAALGFAFSRGSSGPWGDDIPGDWMTFWEARSTYLGKRHCYFSQRQSLFSFWYDWHATL
jgi:FkbM family methyltransferase